MTVLVDDPLIASMAITRALPLHESSRRLRELYPECPRVYGVAVMGDLPRRRWWPLDQALTTDRMFSMFKLAAEETESRAAVAQQLTATLAHVVIGHVVPLIVLEGRAWDTGLENLWVHVDSEGAIDWVGVVDPTLRALPDDPFFGSRTTMPAGNPARDGIVALPERGGADDLDRTSQPPHPRAVVRQACRGERVSHPDRIDVAHRRGRGGERGNAGAAAGRLERADQHAQEPGRAGRSGRIRPAGARYEENGCREVMAKLGQPCLCL